jgi:hypothetical protein
MQSIKTIWYAILSAYTRMINDKKRQEQSEESSVVNRVSSQVRYYRTHLFNL